jgi:hypothetical protein
LFACKTHDARLYYRDGQAGECAPLECTTIPIN